MPTKHGRLGAIWLNGVDVSTYFNSADWGAKVGTAETSVFSNTYKQYIAGIAESSLTAAGFYDSANADNVRGTLQVDNGVATYLPAGAVAIGDLARLILVETSDYKQGSKIGGAVTMDWSAHSTAPVGIGVTLLPLSVQAVGTNNQTGDGVMTSLQSTTGAIAHAHVTAYTSGSQTIKFQDATTIGGAYSDIASGAFPAITATGGYRLVIPGTIRQFVRCVTIIAGAQITVGVAFART